MTERQPEWVTRQQRTADTYAAYLRSIDRVDAPLAVLNLKGKRVPGERPYEGDLLDIPAFLRRTA